MSVFSQNMRDDNTRAMAIHLYFLNDKFNVSDYMQFVVCICIQIRQGKTYDTAYYKSRLEQPVFDILSESMLSTKAT